jgi:5-(carboxyamino)imidazole ribonucleotide synthase
VTYEFENVPVRSAEVLEAAGAPVRPGAEALRVSQDRLDEKEFFRGLGIATAPFRAVDSREDLAAAVEEIGLPAVLKTRRMGYDGKGQAVLRSPADLAGAWEALGGRPLVLEGFVEFRRELSVIAARGTGGAIQVYPVVENTHEDGILRRSRAPALKVSDICRVGANRIARGVLERLDYVGVVAVELFETGDGLIANEMAPRVHNSGHWSIEGAETSQFENHLRAIAGLPLGSTRVSAPGGHGQRPGHAAGRGRRARPPRRAPPSLRQGGAAGAKDRPRDGGRRRCRGGAPAARPPPSPAGRPGRPGSRMTPRAGGWSTAAP